MHRHLFQNCGKDEGISSTLQCKKYYFFFKSKNKKKKKLLHPKMIIINKPMTTWLKATCFTSEQRKVCYTSEFNKYIFFSLDELPSQTHFPFHSCVFSLQKYHIFNCIALPWYLAQYNSLRASASLYHAHNQGRLNGGAKNAIA